MRVQWSEQALSDTKEIHNFIAQDAPAFARLFEDRVFEAVERLADFPLSGRVVPEYRHPGLRQILLGSYRIIYRLRDDSVVIATVVHSARLIAPFGLALESDAESSDSD